MSFIRLNTRVIHALIADTEALLSDSLRQSFDLMVGRGRTLKFIDLVLPKEYPHLEVITIKAKLSRYFSMFLLGNVIGWIFFIPDKYKGNLVSITVWCPKMPHSFKHNSMK